jgi:hypothetical protein
VSEQECRDERVIMRAGWGKSERARLAAFVRGFVGDTRPSENRSFALRHARGCCPSMPTPAHPLR